MELTYTRYLLNSLPMRPQESNKGTFGRVTVAGGSKGMSGAAYLAAKAAYRTGCGLVSIVCPEANRVIYQTQLPEAVLKVYPDEGADGDWLKDALAGSSAIVLGPGLGQSENALNLVKWTPESASMPIVLDADGLNLLAAHPELWSNVPFGTVITPHPAEMARLLRCPVENVTADIPGTALSFASERGVICVLKSHRTAVTDGDRLMVNNSGNSGMATGGSGDVLAGIIASLIAQGMAPYNAACLGVYLHGLAGDDAAARLGEHALMASDIIDSLPAVLKAAE
ncbi:MAG: NAD(P)H-hydrate dehydratase [Mailhella sp.]|nr:NAD(P)H-hydrate dehydratase [Mailhella sp.]